jgi:CheY-like chemotaxis protein
MERRVLVVDDEIAILRLIRLALRRMGLQVVTARDGVEALELVSKLQPTLIITDLLMPSIGGLELVRILKKDPKTAEIPVIVLTSMTSYHDMQRGYNLGAVLYLTKPFTLESLQEAVNKVLAAEEAGDESGDDVQI